MAIGHSDRQWPSDPIASYDVKRTLEGWSPGVVADNCKSYIE